MITAIIQARMGSTRLPDKVLYDLNGRPMLSCMIERVKASTTLNSLMIATSTDSSDDAIADFCEKQRVLCYRGNLNDVLDRYYMAALKLECDVVVRMTADCPLIDFRIIDLVVDTYTKNHYDYVANTVPPTGTFPDGMDVEVFSFKALEKAWKEAVKPSEREHVTFYFWKNPQIFSVFRYDLPQDLSKYRLTVDYPEDFEVVSAIFKELYPKNPLFSMEEIIQFLESQPEIYNKNAHLVPNQGWKPALEMDKQLGL